MTRDPISVSNYNEKAGMTWTPLGVKPSRFLTKPPGRTLLNGGCSRSGPDVPSLPPGAFKTNQFHPNPFDGKKMGGFIPPSSA